MRPPGVAGVGGTIKAGVPGALNDDEAGVPGALNDDEAVFIPLSNKDAASVDDALLGKQAELLVGGLLGKTSVLPVRAVCVLTVSIQAA